MCMRIDSQNTLYITGWMRSKTNNFLNQYVLKVPNDGTKTGTYVIDSGNSLYYGTVPADNTEAISNNPLTTGTWSFTNTTYSYINLVTYDVNFTWSYTNPVSTSLGFSKVTIA